MGWELKAVQVAEAANAEDRDMSERSWDVNGLLKVAEITISG